MRKQRHAATLLTIGAATLGLAATSLPAVAAGQGDDRRANSPAEYWTAERRDAAIPRDLYLDQNGNAYTRGADGTLIPYGSDGGAQLRAEPAKGKPGGGGGGGGGDTSDTTPPSIGGQDPNNVTIGSSYTFSATVTDDSGIKSVSFVVVYPNGSTTQSFSPQAGGGGTYTIDLSGFTDGRWSWYVVAKDNAGKGGNTATSGSVPFTVDTGSGGGSTGGGESNSTAYTGDGTVRTAAGRIYFQMPNNPNGKGPWNGYVCSGTVVTDGVADRSVILTAAHCLFDDVSGYFARNVLFIPDQANTVGSGTDTNCGNDPLGCWSPEFGVVDVNYTLTTFPDNSAWDYAYYVVDDGLGNTAHSGAGTGGALDVAAGSLPVDFGTQTTEDNQIRGMGYSYADDPAFMYCDDPLSFENPVYPSQSTSFNYWLQTCDLTGGSSGGPWLANFEGGSGDIISVNSWGYTTAPGMAGPVLNATSSAQCLFGVATDLGVTANTAVDSSTSC